MQTKCRAGLLVMCGALLGFVPIFANDEIAAINPDSAMVLLKQGNGRFVSGKALHPNSGNARREETATNGQHPYVSILGCADSRVPLEVIFDAGIGDIFNVRVAGNVADIDEIGTLEYGAGHLGTPLIVVLGHSKCGAVTAVCKGDHVTPNIAKLVDNIGPAVEKARKAKAGVAEAEVISKAITENVWQAIKDIISKSPEIYQLIETGKVKLVGALYDIETGKVAWLGQHPELIRIMVETKLAEARSVKPPHTPVHPTVPAKKPETPKPAKPSYKH